MVATAAASVPSVTLSEVLQLTLPTGSKVICGEERLWRQIHWARLVRARPAGIGSVEPGELLIVPAALVEGIADPRTLGRLFSELIEAGVAAFVVAAELPEAACGVCQQTATPLILVPRGHPLSEVERAIVTLILDRDSQLRRRADEIYDRLLTTMLGNAGLPALVLALHEASSLGVAVLDDYLALQACQPDDQDFAHRLGAAANGVLLRELRATTLRSARPVVFGFRQETTTWSGHLHPLQIGDAWAGYLALVRRENEAGELDRLLADRASTLVALELAKQRAVDEATQRWRGDFLDDLLDGGFPSDDAILARGRQLGYDLTTTHLTLMVAPDHSSEGERLETRTVVGRQRRRFADVTRATVSRLLPSALVVERDGGVVVLVPTGGSGSEQARRAFELVDQARQDIEQSLPELSVSVGVGSTASQPRDFAGAQREAATALGIAQKLLGGGQVVHYQRLGIERLLFHLLDEPELGQFAHDVLGILVTYDVRHGTDLVQTLEVFLRCNGNHVRAAQELHLHRNTLLYRLDRVRDILQRDLEDSETRLALQLALRIRRAVKLEERLAPVQKARRARPRSRTRAAPSARTEESSDHQSA